MESINQPRDDQSSANAATNPPDLRETFQLCDTCGDGKIYVKQVGDCLRMLGTNPSEATIEHYTRPLTAMERIGMDQFEPIYQQVLLLEGQPKSEDLLYMLRCLDKQSSGRVPAAQLRHMLTRQGEQLSEADVDPLLAEVMDADGNVNCAHFIDLLLNG